MRPSPSKITILALSALALGTSSPASARDGTGGGVYQNYKAVTAEEAKDPGIMKPDDPGVDCYTEVSGQEAGNIRASSGIKNLGRSCLPQQDAFKRAAEAASYLAFYQQNFSDYSNHINDPEKRREIQAALKECVNNGPNCNQVELMKALVQYNFGKELKAQMVENQSRAVRMKSVDLGAQGWREIDAKPTKLLNWENSRRSSPVRQNTFRLDPTKVSAVAFDKLSAEERNMLGAEFNRDFDGFVNEYSSSTGQRGPKSRWHYVTAKSAAVDGADSKITVAAPDYRNTDPLQGRSAIDTGRLDRDIYTQDKGNVREIVESFRKNYRDVLAQPTQQQTVRAADGKEVKVNMDAMKAAYEDSGFGLPRSELDKIGEPNGPRDPNDVAAAVVITINKAINDKEKEMNRNHDENQPDRRMPSSAGAAKPNVIPSVTVDVQKFDEFLDAIWPTGYQLQK